MNGLVKRHQKKKYPRNRGTSECATGKLPDRLRFPDDEKRLSWLPALLDSYAIVDEGVAIAIRKEQERSGRRLACGEGCGNCCKHQKDLPLFPHELMGIYWYVSDKVSKEQRAMLMRRFAAHGPGSRCPFLLEDYCLIHPMRPMGCRQFNVFDRQCAPGEDPYYTRRDDVMTPLPQHTDRAFAAVTGFYQVDEKDVDAAIGLIRAQMINLLDYDWRKLATARLKQGKG